MKKRYKSSVNKIFDFDHIISVAIQAVFMTVMTLLAFGIGYDFGDTATAMTMAFTTLGLTQIFHCFDIKHDGSVFNKSIFDNKFMNISVVVTLFIMLFLIFTPAGALFGLTSLSFSKFMICLSLAFAVVPVSEITKITRWVFG